MTSAAREPESRSDPTVNPDERWPRLKRWRTAMRSNLSLPHLDVAAIDWRKNDANNRPTLFHWRQIRADRTRNHRRFGQPFAKPLGGWRHCWLVLACRWSS